MIHHNELTIDGVKTSSFPFKVIVEDSPSFILSESKTLLLEHDGISGAIVQSNPHRELVEKTYTIYLVKPSEDGLHQLLALFSREGFWLENEQTATTRLWCYKVKKTQAVKDKNEVYRLTMTFVCHPTKYFKTIDSQILTQNGVLKTQGSALAFPKIRITGSGSGETTLTVGGQVIRLEKITETLVMENNPDKPSFKTLSGNLVKWSGDFITVNPLKMKSVGVVLGTGIQSVTFETNWGWA